MNDVCVFLGGEGRDELEVELVILPTRPTKNPASS